MDSGIGSNQDSFYEYLLKGYMLFNDPDLLAIFEDMYAGVRTHMKKGHWYVDVHMSQGSMTLPWFTALSAFWPGLQVCAALLVWCLRCLARSGVGLPGLAAWCVSLVFCCVCLCLHTLSLCLSHDFVSLVWLSTCCVSLCALCLPLPLILS